MPDLWQELCQRRVEGCDHKVDKASRWGEGEEHIFPQRPTTRDKSLHRLKCRGNGKWLRCIWKFSFNILQYWKLSPGMAEMPKQNWVHLSTSNFSSLIPRKGLYPTPFDPQTQSKKNQSRRWCRRHNTPFTSQTPPGLAKPESSEPEPSCCFGMESSPVMRSHMGLT